MGDEASSKKNLFNIIEVLRFIMITVPLVSTLCLAAALPCRIRPSGSCSISLDPIWSVSETSSPFCLSEIPEVIDSMNPFLGDLDGSSKAGISPFTGAG